MSWNMRKAEARWDFWKARKAARRAMRGMDRDKLLARMGLEERNPAGDLFGGLGVFALGILVGAGLGLLFAPRPGEETRTKVGEAWKNRRVGKDELRDLGSEGRPSPMPAM